MKESEIILYTTPNGEVKIDIRFEDETFWLPQQKIADLFGVDRSVVTKHLGNIYSERELDKTAICAKFAQVRNEGESKVKAHPSTTLRIQHIIEIRN